MVNIDDEVSHEIAPWHVRVSYWALLKAFKFLHYRRSRALQAHRKWERPLEMVHRPIRTLGAKYMDDLVNGRTRR